MPLFAAIPSMKAVSDIRQNERLTRNSQGVQVGPRVLRNPEGPYDALKTRAPREHCLESTISTLLASCRNGLGKQIVRSEEHWNSERAQIL